jgi:hypothetical protein
VAPHQPPAPKAPAPAPTAATAAPAPFSLPSDAKLYNNGFGVFAVFDVGHGILVSYGVNWWDNSVKLDASQVQPISADDFKKLNTVDAGNAEELKSLGNQYPTYKGYFDHVVDGVMSTSNTGARNDASVMRVMAEKAGRPDMSDIEMKNLLTGTDWWKSHTASELQYNDLSEPDKQLRRDNTKADMKADIFKFTGQNVDDTDPRIANYLEDIASGKSGIGGWVETSVKPSALADSESPWSREIRTVKEDAGKRGVDLENTTQKVKDLAQRWGVQWAPSTLSSWASKIISNQASEADVLTELQNQAKVLYPWKDVNTETSTAAAPWLNTYERVMEKPTTMFDPKVQAALTAGTPAWSFEQQLKKSPEWLTTKNARQEMVSNISEAGRRLGFV